MVDFEENKLIENIKKGDNRAFDKLVQMYMKRAYSVAFRYMQKDEDAQDMVQEAFIKVYINIDKFNENYGFSSWFYRILINCCINALKRRQKSGSLTYPWEKDKEIGVDDNIGDLNVTKDPEEDLILKEKNRIIMDGINSLPSKQKDVLILYDIEGFDQREISNILNIPVGSVMSRLFYGRKKLKKYLEKFLKEA